MYTFLERRNAENRFTTNIKSTAAIADFIALNVEYNEPPLKDVSLPGTAPTKELFGFEEK